MHVACYATDGPSKISPPGPSTAIFVIVGGPPDHVWLPQMVPQTIYSAISGPLLPQSSKRSLMLVVDGPRGALLYLRYV